MRRAQHLLIATSVFAALLTGSSYAASATGIPATIVPIEPTAHQTARVTQELAPARTLSGTVTAATGGALRAQVFLLDAHDGEVATTFSNRTTGAYTFKGVAPANNRYHVCVNGQGASNGTVTVGYLGTCYPAVAWPDNQSGPLPAGAKPIDVPKGKNVSGIDVALPTGAAIAGTVTDPTSAAVPGVAVWLRNPDDDSIYHATTGADGTYLAVGLTASTTGYTICFSTLEDPSATGLVPQCFSGVPWSGQVSDLPAGATTVPVATGSVHGDTDAQLASAGAIVGQVTDAATTKPIANISVAAYSSGGDLVEATATNAGGGYRLGHLSPTSAYLVCTSPQLVSAALAYPGQCYQGVAWNGLLKTIPATSTPVTVKAGLTHSGIRFALTSKTYPVGVLDGHVVGGSKSIPVPGATVSVWSPAGKEVASVQTGPKGGYVVPNLAPTSQGYRVCAQAPPRSADQTAPVTGWGSACLDDKLPWVGPQLAPPTDPEKVWGSGQPTKFPPCCVKSGSTERSMEPNIRYVRLKGGQTRKLPALDLPTGARIVGYALTAAKGHAGIDHVRVTIFRVTSRTDAGIPLATTLTGAAGRFVFSSLTAGSSVSKLGSTGHPSYTGPMYKVCLDGSSATHTTTGFQSDCFRNVAWDPASI